VASGDWQLLALQPSRCLADQGVLREFSECPVRTSLRSTTPIPVQLTPGRNQTAGAVPYQSPLACVPLERIVTFIDLVGTATYSSRENNQPISACPTNRPFHAKSFSFGSQTCMKFPHLQAIMRHDRTAEGPPRTEWFV